MNVRRRPQVHSQRPSRVGTESTGFGVLTSLWIPASPLSTCWPRVDHLISPDIQYSLFIAGCYEISVVPPTTTCQRDTHHTPSSAPTKPWSLSQEPGPERGPGRLPCGCWEQVPSTHFPHVPMTTRRLKMPLLLHLLWLSSDSGIYLLMIKILIVPKSAKSQDKCHKGHTLNILTCFHSDF